LFHILSVEQLLDQLAFSDLFDEYSIKGNYLKEEISIIIKMSDKSAGGFAPYYFITLIYQPRI